MADQKYKAIQKFPFFQKGFSEHNLKQVAEVLQEKVFKQDEVLLKEGEPQQVAYLVLSGKVIQNIKGEGYDQKKEFDLIGLNHLFTRDPIFATSIAKKDTETLALTFESLEKLLKIDELKFAFLAAMAFSLRQATKTVNRLKGPSGFNVAFFDFKPFWREPFEKALKKAGNPFNLHFLPQKLLLEAIPSKKFDAIIIFVNDLANEQILRKLKEEGVSLIALRCAGFNNVDRKTAKELNMPILRVPAYSPYAIAEHSIALLLTLNRKIHIAVNRVKEGNFSLSGLVGFDLFGKTIGLFGTGKIGRCALNIWKGFGCKILLHDLYPNKSLECENVKYVTFDEMLAQSDVVTLHCPLTKETKGLFNEQVFKKMKDRSVLINTSRGPLIDTKALIQALKKGKLRGAAMDVYENENKFFFEDLSNEIAIEDPLLSQLTSFKNVIVTGHQAFLTEEALTNIADTTVQNIIDFQNNNLKNNKNIVDQNSF